MPKKINFGDFSLKNKFRFKTKQALILFLLGQVVVNNKAYSMIQYINNKDAFGMGWNFSGNFASLFNSGSSVQIQLSYNGLNQLYDSIFISNIPYNLMSSNFYNGYNSNISNYDNGGGSITFYPIDRGGGPYYFSVGDASVLGVDDFTLISNYTVSIPQTITCQNNSPSLPTLNFAKASNSMNNNSNTVNVINNGIVANQAAGGIAVSVNNNPSENLYGCTLTLVNAGSIQGHVVGSNNNVLMGLTMDNIVNSGTLNGNITGGDSSLLVNSTAGGILNGNITGGPGGLTVNVSGGTINGNITGTLNGGVSVSGTGRITGTVTHNSGPYALSIYGAQITGSPSQAYLTSSSVQFKTGAYTMTSGTLQSPITLSIVDAGATFTVNSGAVISVPITLNGSLHINGGGINGNITGIDSASNIEVLTGAFNVVSLISGVNAFTVHNGTTTTVSSGGSINKITNLAGTLNINGGTVTGPITGSGTSNILEVQSGTFTTASTISGINSFIIDSGATTNINAGGSINKITNLIGTLKINGGTVTGPITGSGTSNILEVQSGTFTTASTISGINSFIIDSGATITANAGGSINKITNLIGTLKINGGTVSGPITGSGTSNTIEVQSGTFTAASTISGINSFIIDSGATTTVNTGGSINKITNLIGTLNINGGTVSGPITGSGTSNKIEVQSGTFTTASTITGINDFTIDNNATAAIDTNGSISGSIFNNGTISLNGGSITGNITGSSNNNNIDFTSLGGIITGNIGCGSAGLNMSVNGSATILGNVVGADGTEQINVQAGTFNFGTQETANTYSLTGIDNFKITGTTSTTANIYGGVFTIGNFNNNATGIFNANSGKITLGYNYSGTSILDNQGAFNVVVGNANALQGVYLNSNLTNSTSTGIISINSGGDISSGNGIVTLSNTSPGSILLKSGGSLGKNDTDVNILKIFGNITSQGGISYAEIEVPAFGTLKVGAGSKIYGNVYGNVDGQVIITGDFTTNSKITNVGTVLVQRTLPDTTTFNVLDPIAGVAKQFKTNTGTTVNIGVGGDISGSSMPPYKGTSITIIPDYITTYATTIVIPQPQPISLTVPNDTQVVASSSGSTLQFNSGNNNVIQLKDNVVGDRYGGESVLLSVSHGTLSATPQSNVTVTTSSGGASCTITNNNTSSLTNLNTVLSSLVYTPALNYIGTDTLSITANADCDFTTGGSSSPVKINTAVPINVVSVGSSNVTVGPAQITTYLEGSPPVLVDPTVNINNLQLPTLYPLNTNNYQGSTITINREGGPNSDDLFSFATLSGMTVNNNNAATGIKNTITKTSNNTILANLNVINSSNQVAGQLQITFQNSNDINTTIINQILEAVQYSNNSNTPPSYLSMVYSVNYNGNISPVVNSDGTIYEMVINNAGTININGGTIGALLPMNIVSNSGMFNLNSGSGSGYSSTSTPSTTTVVTTGTDGSTSTTSVAAGAAAGTNQQTTLSGVVRINEFINCSLLSGPTLNINSGNMYVASKIYNFSGGIKVSGGDLSSMNDGSSDLTNVAQQTITVTSSGSVGQRYRLGDVTNEGIINIAGNVAISDFTNTLIDAQLNITSGKTTTFGDITNFAGNITVSGGDLSSDANYSSYSNLINNANGVVKVSGGTLGAKTRLGNLSNDNKITFDDGGTSSTIDNNIIINIGTLTNNLTGNIIIKGYNVQTANNTSLSADTITNTGNLEIKKGDLSGTAKGAILTNTGTLIISDNGSVGANYPLVITQSGAITTSGTVNANITFGSPTAPLIINGGIINGSITGSSTASSSNNQVNINVINNGTFTITNGITNISAINIENGNVKFNPSTLTSIIDSPIVLKNNSGIKLSLNGGTVTNTITGGSGGYELTINNALVTNAINIGSSGAPASSNIFSVSGQTSEGIQIPIATDASAIKIITSSNNDATQDFNISGGKLSNQSSTNAVLNINNSDSGTNSNGANTFNISGNSIIQNVSSTTPKAINVSNNGATTINISGTPTVIGSITVPSLTNNVLNIGVTTPTTTAANFISPTITNMQTINIVATTGVNNFTIGSAITGVNTNFFTNTGTVTTIAAGGSLSGSASIGTSTTPSAGTINISGTDSTTVVSMGNLYNAGSINLTSGKVQCGVVVNQSSGAGIEVTGGSMQTGNIINTLGHITVSSGDWSSTSGNSSSLSNANNQVITVSGGTVGSSNPLGAITNSGIINLSNGSISFSTLSNNSNGNIQISGSTINASGTNAAISNSGQISISNGQINVTGSGGYINNSGQLTVTASSNIPIVGAVTNTTLGKIDIAGSTISTPFNLNLTTSGTAFGNNGIININSGKVGLVSLNNNVTGTGSSQVVGQVNIKGGTGLLSGNATNSGAITVGGILTCPNDQNSVLTNTGTLTIDQSGSIILPLSITNNSSGTITSAGTVTSPINFVQSSTGILNITGGTISSSITGGVGGSNNSASGTINIQTQSGGTFTTGNVIRNIATINVKSGNFIVNQPIVGIQNSFNTSSATLTTISSGGDLGGMSNLLGGSSSPASSLLTTYATTVNINAPLQLTVPTVALSVENTGVASTSVLSFVDEDNKGLINILDTSPVVSGENVQLSVLHGILSLSTIPSGVTLNPANGGQSTLTVTANTIDTLQDALNKLQYTPNTNYVGADNVSIGAHNINSSLVINANIPIEVFPVGVVVPINGNLNLQSYTEGGAAVTINSTIQASDLQLNLVNPGISNYNGISITVARTNGTNVNDLFLLPNSISYGTPSETVTVMTVGSNLTLTKGGNNVATGSNINGQLQINFVQTGSGNLTISDPNLVTALLQAIQYKNTTNSIPSYLDLSYSVTASTPSSGSNMEIINIGTITVNGGSIGGVMPMGTVNNLGIINIGASSSGGATSSTSGGSNIVNVGEFINRSLQVGPTFNIMAGKVTTGDITNISGGMAISGGDLSSSNEGASNLVNVEGQTITVSGTGTIGAAAKLGHINNEGKIIANGGDITVTSFSNSTGNSNLQIKSGNVITSGDLNNLGTISISGGGLYSNVSATLTNKGTLIVNSDGTLGASGINLDIQQGGNMTVAGIVNGNINFATDSAQLIISGGTITGNIVGYNVTNHNVITIDVPNGIFTAGGNITNIDRINLKAGTFVIKDNMASSVFFENTVDGAAAITLDGGSITGTITGGTGGNTYNINSGTISGVINASTGANTFNINSGSNIQGGANSSLSIAPTGSAAQKFIISGGTVANSSSTDATINVDNSSSYTGKNNFSISGGAISNNGGGDAIAVSSSIDGASNVPTSITITNAPNINGAIVLPSNTPNTLTIGSSGAAADFLTSGPIVNAQTIQVNNTTGVNNFTINDQISGVADRFTTLAGTTTTITGGGGLLGGGMINNAGILNVTTDGEIGNNSSMGYTINSGTINGNGGDIELGMLVNGDLTTNVGGLINISKGVMHVKGVNNLGTITISGTSAAHGDLSSFFETNHANITNAANKTLAVTGTGVIGEKIPIKDVSNSGIVSIANTNPNSIAVTVNNFTNMLAGSKLNIISGNMVLTGTIANNYGQITIVDGDLSSGSASNPSNLANADYQIVTVSGTGTLGAKQALHAITNTGTINAQGGNITADSINNGYISGSTITSTLNITSGIVAINTVNNNTTGVINITGGGLSSRAVNNYGNINANVNSGNVLINGTLNNNSTGCITVSGGTLTVANGSLGYVNNSGVIKVVAGTLTGNLANANLNNSGTLIVEPNGILDLPLTIVQSGIIQTAGTIKTPIKFASTNNVNTLTVTGGTITAAITGSTEHDTDVSVMQINLTDQASSFTVSDPIINVKTIAVQRGNLVINDLVNGVSDQFSTVRGTLTTIGVGGDLSGVPANLVNNSSTLTGDLLATYATTIKINTTLAIAAPRVTQTVYNNTSLLFNASNNNAISISDHNSIVSNESVEFTVSHGTLSLDLGSPTLTDLTVTGLDSNLLTITGTNAVTLTDLNSVLNYIKYTPNSNYVGVDSLGITANNPNANLSINTTVPIALVAPGTIIDLTGTELNLANYTEGGSPITVNPNITATTLQLNTLCPEITTYNGINITVARTGGANINDLFSLPSNFGQTITNSSGILRDQDNNNIATITNNNGQLQINFVPIATGNATVTSDIFNAVIQNVQYSDHANNPPVSIDVSYFVNANLAGSSNMAINNSGSLVVNGGSIGIKLPMGEVNNTGTFTVGDLTTKNTTSNSNVVNVGDFVNYSTQLSPTLYIMSGQMTTGNIRNISGGITVAGGDLSSAALSSSNLINVVGQTVTISESGTIGKAYRLGNVLNEGSITAKGGDVAITTFTNSLTEASLNINSGNITTQGSINNALGSITLNGGALYSIVDATLSNTGTLTVNTGATLGPPSGTVGGILTVEQSGVMTTSGIVNANLEFGTLDASLTVAGGQLNGTITGATGNNTNTIIVSIPGGSFTISKGITNVNKINILKGNFVFNPTTSSETIASNIFLGSDPAVSVTIGNGVISSTIQGGAGGDLYNIGGGTISGSITGGIGGDTYNISGGNIAGGIDGGDGGDQFKISGGKISSAIIGGKGSNTFTVTNSPTFTVDGDINIPSSNSGSINTLNIGTLSTVSGGVTTLGVAANFISHNITNITTINVQQTSGNNNFTIGGSVTGVNNYFTTLSGTTTNIGTSGSLSGAGTIGVVASTGTITPSLGAIVLSDNGTINMNNIYNGGVIILGTSSGNGIVVNNLYNLTSGELNITSGKLSGPGGAAGAIINSGKIIITTSDPNNIAIAPISNNTGGEIDVIGGASTALTLGLATGGNSGIININNGLVAINSLTNNAKTTVGLTIVPSGQINVNGGVLTLLGTDANNNGTMTIYNGAKLTGVTTGSPGVTTQLTNSGDLIVNAGAVIDTPLTILLHGSMGNLQSAGTINAAIQFDTDVDHTLTITGGIINGTISGNNVTTSSININLPTTTTERTVTTKNTISNVQKIQVTAGDFTVLNAITGVDNSFTTNLGAVTTIGGGGSLIGAGTVGSLNTPNKGSIILSDSGTMNMTGTIYNGGAINIQTSSGNGMIVNNLNNSGQLNIISGDLSAAAGVINSTITNTNQISISGTGTIGSNREIAMVTNSGTINANSNSQAININSLINQATGVLNINGSMITVSGPNNAVNNTGKITISKGQLIASNLTGAINNTGNITINAAQNNVAISPITNNAGGIIDITGGASIPVVLGLASGGNSGTINVNTGLVAINSLTNNAGSTVGATLVPPGQININGGTLRLSGTNNSNNGVMVVAAGSTLEGTSANTNLINIGNLIVNAGSVINGPLTITQSGTIQSAGTINAAINFGNDAAHELIITGGTINGAIQGSSSQNSTITINIPTSGTVAGSTTSFITNGLITNVNVINVNSGNLIVNNNISGIGSQFNTSATTTTTINTGGNLAGGGVISNFGNIQLSGGVTGGTIGKNVAMGDVYNVGTITASGGNMVVGAFVNGDHTAAVNLPGVLTINSGMIKTGNIANNYGRITVAGGDLSSVTLAPANSTISNASEQIITISGTGTIGASTAFGAVTNSGAIYANGGAINIGALTNNSNGQINVGGSNISVANVQPATGYTITNNGQININSGDLSGSIIGANLDNSGTINLGQVATGSSANGGATLGGINSLGAINNSGTMNINGNVYMSSGVNNTTTGNIAVYSSGKIASNGGSIQNFGNFTVAANGVVEVFAIVQSGNMTTAGIINTPINFDIRSTTNASLTISGGSINRTITGNGEYSKVIIDMPNGNTFATTNPITNVGTLQVGTVAGQLNNLIINNPIVGITNAFITYAGTVTTIAAGGDLSGVIGGTSGTTGSSFISSNGNLVTYAVTVNITQPLANIVPQNQVVNENTGQAKPLIFSNSNSNSISIIDQNGIGGIEQVVLKVNHGTISMPDISNLSSYTISSDQTTITIHDTLDNINNVLNGLEYIPTINYTGLDQLTITTSNNTQGDPIAVTSYIPINILSPNEINNFIIPPIGQYTEGSIPIPINSQVTVTDLQLNNQSDYNNTAITIARSTGANNNDIFSFPSSSFGTNNIISSGALINGVYSSSGTLTSNGTVIANFTNSVGQLQLTFTSNATATLVNEIIEAVHYSNYSSNPPATINLTYAVKYINGSNNNMAINNSGIITLAKPSQVASGTTTSITTTTELPAGTIGATTPMGIVTNAGIINANGGNITVKDFINCSTAVDNTTTSSQATAAFNISSGNIKVGNIKNIAGGIAITGGDLSSSLEVPNNVINFIGQKISISGSGTLGVNFPVGDVINEGTITFGGGNVVIGDFTNTLNGANLTISSGNVKTSTFLNYLGSFNITGGDLSGVTNNLTLTNSIGQTITASGGTIGTSGIFDISNNGTFNVSGCQVTGGTFTNDGLGAATGALLNITNGSLKTNTFLNNYGTVIVSGGDLSASSDNLVLTNAAGQTITGSGGTIGANGIFNILNNGIFNVSGSNVTVGTFSNNATDSNRLAVLNVTSGTIKTGAFTNAAGSILINGGDLSAAAGSAVLTNAVGQNITVSGGSIGANGRFSIANEGIVAISEGRVAVEQFTNFNSSSLLNVINGSFVGNTLLNTVGEVLIGGGSLTVDSITNTSIFNVDGGNVVVANFSNNNLSSSLNINLGSVVATTLQNKFGNIIITGGDLSGTGSKTAIYTNIDTAAVVADSTSTTTNTVMVAGSNNSILTNEYNQSITISGGTIGNKGIFIVNNSGIINAQNSLIAIDQFNNNNAIAQLNINSANIVANKINNNLGYIAITAGDISSLNASVPCDLTNAVNQTIVLSGTGTIGAYQALGAINNNGTINATGGNVNVGIVTNNNINARFNITSGNILTGDFNNILGIVTISGGDLSSISMSNPSSLVNGVEQEFTVTGVATLGQNHPIGEVKNSGTITFNASNIAIGDFTNDDNSAVLNITSGNIVTGNINNNLGIISINNSDLSSVDPNNPSNIRNASGQEITITGTGTIGVNGIIGVVSNSGTITANGGSIMVNSLVNNDLQASVNISSGNLLTSNITNTLGVINISGGDLSSIDPSNPGTLINGSEQQINIFNLGTIGANYSLGAVTNSGIINTTGSIVGFGDFVNNAVGASLNISAGKVTVNSITNTNGSISISGGDLSSISGSASKLINGALQVITVSGSGTIGANNPLGEVINNGVIQAEGGAVVKIGSFTNNQGGVLNIIGSQVYAGNILNELGSIEISNGGDLSSSNSTVTNASFLVNALGQNITINSGGSLGLNQAIGNIVNYGTIIANTSINNAVHATGVISNYPGAILTINNSSSEGVDLAGGFNNQGKVNINNTTNNTFDIKIASFTNYTGGTLNINGACSLGFSNLINENGGVVNIGANFDLGSNARDFINNGTVVMQKTANIANGNYILGATGTHIASIDDSGSRQLNLLNGALTLTTGATIGIQAPNNALVVDKMIYPIASFTNGITVNGGDLSSIDVLGDTGLISYTLSVTGNNLAVVANRSSVQTIVDRAGDFVVSPVAAEIDKLFQGASIDLDLTTALLQIEKLSKVEIDQAVIQLSPEVNIIDPKITNFEAVFNAIGNRTDLIARAGIKEINTGYVAGGIQSRGSFWIKGLGGSINQTQRNSYPGYLATSIGFVTGADVEIIDDAWFGLAFSSVGTKLKSKDWTSKTTNIASYQATIYASYAPEEYYVDGYAALAVNRYKTARNIMFGGINKTATATFNGIQPMFKVASGYIHELEKFRIIPNVSLQYSMLHHNKYKENGAGGIGLEQVSNTGLGQLEGGIGVKLSVLHYENEGIYNPDIHAMVLRDFRNNNLETTAKFIGGGGSFKISGAPQDRTTYNLGAGVTIIHKEQLHFTANYELRKKNNFIGHSGSLAVRYEI